VDLVREYRWIRGVALRDPAVSVSEPLIGLTAGGGGHTGYAVAIAQRLAGRARLFFFVSAGDKWSIGRVKGLGGLLEVPRLRSPDKLVPAIMTLHRLAAAYLRSLRGMPRGLSLLVSTGSSQAVAPSLAAKTLGKRLLNLECSDRIATPTRTARLLYRFADETLLAWEEQLRFYPRGVVVGPVYEKAEHKPYKGGYVLFTMGTYGYKELFDQVVRLSLEKAVVQTGKIDPEPYRKARPGWVFFDFDPDIGKWIAGADVVVTHPGVTALSAALAYGKPVVIVHNPRWALAGTREDARMLAEKLNGVFLEEMDPPSIMSAIREAESRPPPRYPDGAENIAKLILSYAQEH
jgi:UDP-N-acetylglucosamine--N-acetylmuramyl-(pentapeptide) pyrophosphoryl-undecaprenol N-acetylglucosamine transferase